MDAATHQQLRQLLDDYLRMYATRDDRLTAQFSEDFSGFTGGGDFLVKDKERWVGITRQDFSQVKEPLWLELKDVAIQSLAETVAVATSFFTIHLPIKDHVLSRETARLVLIFRKEPAGWKISHSSISIPYYGVREGEVYPLKDLADRNQTLERIVAERTEQLSSANNRLQQVNAALHRSEERYRSILNASPDDITITDREGRVIMVSPVAKALFRHSGSEDFVGRLATDFIVPEDRERAMAQVARKYQGISTGPSVYLGLRSDGTTFDLEINSELIRDADGSPAGMVIIARDITERIKQQQKLQELLAQTEQDAHTKGELLREVNHRVTNNLTAVLGLMAFEKSHARSDPQSIASAFARLDQRIRGLLQVHRMLSHLAWAPVSVHELAGEIILAALQAAPWRQAAVVNVRPGAERVSPRQAGTLAMVINELTTNTVKYGNPAGGAVTIGFEAESDSVGMTLRYRDNGPGYPPEVLAQERSNIGLKLIKELVHGSLGGQVTITNDHGAVATLRIRLEE